MGMISDRQGYEGVERRFIVDRRIQPDRRTNIRFDESGGDRRAGSGRRSSDECLEVIGVNDLTAD